MDYLIVTCPHCGDDIFIMKKEINCTIFRHGVLKTTLKQIDPHSPKDICDRLKADDLIYGCGKPVICDYI
jgi:hypothetical protein